MTICIAAPCIEDESTSIVLCTDWRRSTGLGASDTAMKAYSLREDWYCLGAGSMSDVAYMVNELQRCMKDYDFENGPDIGALLRGAVRARVRAIGDSYTSSRYGMTYDDFLLKGRDTLPPDEFRDTYREIRSSGIGAALIVAGLTGKHTYEICKIQNDGEVTLHDDFAAVGNAEPLAAASLLRRKQNNAFSLQSTIYHVYEAKRDCERLGSVSTETDLIVISHGDGFRAVWEKGFAEMRKIYDAHHRKLLDDEIKQFSEALFS